jgi:formylglycine-generating enzyme required for sulfatase activity
VPERDPSETYRQRVDELLGSHQYGAAIKLLEEIVNLREAQFQKLVTWGRKHLPEVRETDQKLRQASGPLCATADPLLKRHDYTEAVKLLSSVPKQYRSPELRALLQQVTDLRDECDHLEQDIEEAIRNGDAETLPILVKRLCKLKPNHKEAKNLAAGIKQYGAAKFIARSKDGRNVVIHNDPLVEPKNLVLSIILIVGLFIGVSVMVRHYLATSKPSGPMNSPDEPEQPQPQALASQPAATAEIEKKKAPPLPLPTTLTSSFSGMKLKLIPAGEFQMGSPLSEPDREVGEGPQHTVRISHPFYMGTFEVTQREFERTMQTNPSHFSKTGKGKAAVTKQDTSQFPVEQVSWYDAVDFCNNLSQKDGLVSYYKVENAQREKGSIKSAIVTISGGSGYRLPTEAEWEYACRANSKTVFTFGDSLTGEQANIDGNYPAGTKGKKLGRTASVGSYPANAFGLHDLHGNVFEWCFDDYDGSAYEKQRDQNVDPVTDTTGKTRSQRGGAWSFDFRFARSACRGRFTGEAVLNNAGIRVVRNVDQGPTT